MFTKEQQKEYARKHYVSNKSLYIQRATKWHNDNPEKVKEIYHKSNHSPKKKIRDKMWRDKHKPKQETFTFKGKRIKTDHIVRKGHCSKCGLTGLTNLHHEKYDEENPLAHTVELCVRCHTQAHHQFEITA